MQAAGPGGSTFGVARRMLNENGARAFVRGSGAPLLNAVLMNVLMFGAFARASEHYGPLASGARRPPSGSPPHATHI